MQDKHLELMCHWSMTEGFIFQTSRLPETLLNWLPLTTSRIKMAPLVNSWK